MKRSFIVMVILTLFSTLSPLIAQPCPEISYGNAYMGFDALVWFDGRTNDFHLDIQMLKPPHYPQNSPFEHDFFLNSPTQGNFKYGFKTDSICWGLSAKWQFGPDIDYGDWAHFGLTYENIGSLRPIAAIWTLDGKPVACAPFPMPFWDKHWQGQTSTLVYKVALNCPDMCCECMNLSPPYILTGPIRIEQAYWIGIQQPFPLEELYWDNPNLPATSQWRTVNVVNPDINCNHTPELFRIPCVTKIADYILVKYKVLCTINGTQVEIYRFVTQIKVR